MSITHVTDRERELLSRIEMLEAAIVSIQAIVNCREHAWVAWQISKIVQTADAALRADK